MDYVKKYNQIKSEYIRKFGKDSVDQLLLPDLAHDNPVGFDECRKEMEKALKTNTPIAPIDSEILTKLVR